MTPEIEKYMERTGQTEQEVFSGACFYGLDKVLELVRKANKKKKKLVFYYASDHDLQCDIVSYRFE